MFLRVVEGARMVAGEGKSTKSESGSEKLIVLVAGVGSRGDWG